MPARHREVEGLPVQRGLDDVVLAKRQGQDHRIQVALSEHSRNHRGLGLGQLYLQVGKRVTHRAENSRQKIRSHRGNDPEAELPAQGIAVFLRDTHQPIHLAQHPLGLRHDPVVVPALAPLVLGTIQGLVRQGDGTWRLTAAFEISVF